MEEDMKVQKHFTTTATLLLRMGVFVRWWLHLLLLLLDRLLLPPGAPTSVAHEYAQHVVPVGYIVVRVQVRWHLAGHDMCHGACRERPVQHLTHLARLVQHNVGQTGLTGCARPIAVHHVGHDILTPWCRYRRCRVHGIELAQAKEVVIGEEDT